MRSGKWRGMPLAVTIAITVGLGLGLANSARADGIIGPHILGPCPGVPAYDFSTGGPFMAPPVPWGCYAKDPVGDAHKALGYITGPVHACLGHVAGALHGVAGCASGMCNDGACNGGDANGNYSGPDSLAGHGLLDHGAGLACVVPGCGGGPACPHQFHGRPAAGVAIVGGGAGTALAGGAVVNGTVLAGGAVANGTVLAGGAVANGTVVATGGVGTAVVGSSQRPLGGPGFANAGGHSGCGMPGCTIAFEHTHPGFGHGGGGGCGIPGCGVSHTHGGAGVDPGAGTGCNFCGGQGCQKCHGGGHHFKLPTLGLPSLARMRYFVGPGGPVPLTPGYVPYIVATRSPRDYFSFPPRNPNDP